MGAAIAISNRCARTDIHALVDWDITTAACGTCIAYADCRCGNGQSKPIDTLRQRLGACATSSSDDEPAGAGGHLRPESVPGGRLVIIAIPDHRPNLSDPSGVKYHRSGGDADWRRW